MGIDFSALPEARSRTDTTPQATEVIERYAFGSLLGNPEIVTLQDVETHERETYAFAGGVGVTYRRMICLVAGRIYGMNSNMSLMDGDDDGIARIWGRVKLPDKVSASLKENPTKGSQPGILAAEAFHVALLRLGGVEEFEIVDQKPDAVFKTVISRIEENFFG
ncbi:MAG: hypothetical protein EOP83_36420, partial [Verrucomicrobiaceae bacterium]